MVSKMKGRAAGFAKEKIVPVAEGSLQSRAPGSGPGQAQNRQSGWLGSRQVANLGADNGQYAGIGSLQAGWSARQQAQRMQARGENDRQGLSRQSGYGGLEQKHKLGNR
jgi:hypothetical protein